MTLGWRGLQIHTWGVGGGLCLCLSSCGFVAMVTGTLGGGGGSRFRRMVGLNKSARTWVSGVEWVGGGL